MRRNALKYTWRVIGGRGVVYECTTFEEAEEVAGVRGVIEPIEHGLTRNPQGSAKSVELPEVDSVRLLQNLALGVSDVIRGVRVRKVGSNHYVIRGIRYVGSEAASILRHPEGGGLK